MVSQVRAARTPATDLAAIIARGEDSGHQFKRDITHVDGMAAELAAFANMGGGLLLIGVGDGGVVSGLTLQNLNLTRNGSPNLAGLMLFGNAPHIYLPAFTVKAVCFPGTVLHDRQYLDSETIEGTLAQQYQHCMAFLGRNLHHIQGDRGFNSPGQLEIPHHVLEEIVVNALVHRDYLISAPIRLLIYTDRVEIVSPGHLPNHLNTQQIRFGVSNLRNPALASHAFHMLPYHGMGSGIIRALQDWPQIEFTDDRQGDQFRVTLRRLEMPVTTMSGKMSEKVFTVLHGDSTLTIPELAAKPGVATRTIDRAPKQLQQENRVVRVGHTKGSLWEVRRRCLRRHRHCEHSVTLTALAKIAILMNGDAPCK